MAPRRRSSSSPQPPASEEATSSTVATADDGPARPEDPTKWLGALLVEQGSITPELLDEALVEQAESGGRLGEILIRRRVIGESQLVRGLATQLELPIIDLRRWS